MKFIGIDYSMSCPCMCSLGENFIDSNFLYLTNVKKVTGKWNNIEGVLHTPWNTNEQRFDQISEVFISRLRKIDNPQVAVEDYAMGAKGLVFNIGECTGILKHKLHREKISFITVPPTVVKKYATGKGNADKEQMLQAFVEQTGIDLTKLLFPDKKLGSPITDIVDSYFIAKYLRENDNDRSRSTETSNTINKQL